MAKKAYVYMNEQIRAKKVTKPVVVFQYGNKTFESDELVIYGGGGFDKEITSILVKYDPKGLKAVKTHDVKAWVEITYK